MAKKTRSDRGRGPSRPTARPASTKKPAVRAPAQPAMDPDPQEVFDRSVSEYEGDARRETEVAPGEGVTLSDTRSASPAPDRPRHPVRTGRPARKRTRR
jgi:hypothetical protein